MPMVTQNETQSQPKDLKQVLGELKTLQDEYKGRRMPEDVGQKFDRLAEEAAEMQASADRERAIKTLEQSSRRIDNPFMPTVTDVKRDPKEIVGYMTLGDAFVRGEDFQQFKAAGFPQGAQVITSYNGSFLNRPDGVKTSVGLVPVTRSDMETKAVATIGAGVIQADRVAAAVRNVEMDRLTIRDVLNVSNTDSNTVEYVTYGYTQAAAPVAEGALKPEAAMTLGTATSAVRTIAVWMPVTEQQIQDVPQLTNLINTNLSWDVRRTEERQVVWGDGTGQNLLGIMNTPGVTAGRTVTGDTLIDMARRSVTDVRVAGFEPNAIVIHPYDWETIILTKGSGSHYIWVVVTDENGSRLWGLRVIESIAMQAPGANTTNERRMLVGDFARGATLYDRQQTGVQVGWVNDNFIRNMRTIRAEERLAFGVMAPAAFKFRVTQAAVV